MAVALEKQLFLPFLAPIVFRQPQITHRAAAITTHCTRPPQWPSRPFSTTIRTRQDQEHQQPQPKQSANIDDISAYLDDTLDYTKGVPSAPTGRTSHFQSQTAQHSNPPSRASVDDLLGAMKVPSRAPSNWPLTDILDLAPMLDPTGRNRTKRLSGPLTAPEKALPMKLNASVGRTVRVDEEKGMDIARAFRSLDIAIARNNVKRDFSRQRFHERPGLKRKRLRSERWKKRFREGFRGAVSLVMRMKRQGW
ncbi:37S ribosomal protein mrp21, mitochondrial [Teratosphaeria destructans]|uniref:37S ribosomal protein mrp21, mitochondrial n=1 Tax=Teratosphaeria destructans TaxID=418781 RepID=A0A9W7SP68_9PEZI|nr:37S ribosomal protein mrp21, mitochondrial [Teratosphaeria destructans]